MFFGSIEGSVNIPGGPLRYAAFGSGHKDLILIQGLNVRDLKGTGASLALQYRIFAKEYRVYLFDRRAVVKEGLTNWDLAEDIYHAMQALHIGSADVFGVSQGGMIAMALALEHPECVHKLVLGVTAARTGDYSRKVFANWIKCAQNKDHIAINRDTFTLMYTAAYRRKYGLLIPLLVRLIKPKDFSRFAILASALLDFDCYDRLDEIQCPVFVVGADKDMVTTGPSSREIAEKLNCESYMYPEYGHAVFDEAKDFNRRIYEFLVK